MLRLTLNDLLKAFNRRTFTCEEYMLRVISRSNDLKNNNYFTYQQQNKMIEESKQADDAYLRGNARPLEGIPIAFKDNIDIEGEPNSAGTPAFSGRFPKQTAEVAEALLNAGAINAGRCNMNELAYGVTTINPFTGAAKNFWNQDHSCGGSSGGSGGVVGADIVPVALGTDTAGSIRIPASYNAAWGFKPTLNRWPGMYGINMTWTRDVVGPIARSAEDIALLDNIVTGEKTDILNPTDVRIGVPRNHYWEKLHPDIGKQGEEFLVKLKDAGFNLVEGGEIRGVQRVFDDTCFLSCNYEIFGCLEAYIQKNGYALTVEEVIGQIKTEKLKIFLQKLYDNPIQEKEYNTAMKESRSYFIKNVNDYIRDYNLDCFIFPTTKIPSQLLTVRDDHMVLHLGEDWRLLFLMLSNVYTASVANCSGITMPWGRSRSCGVPFGMEINSLQGTDGKLLSIARTIEKFVIN